MLRSARRCSRPHSIIEPLAPSISTYGVLRQRTCLSHDHIVNAAYAQSRENMLSQSAHPSTKSPSCRVSQPHIRYFVCYQLIQFSPAVLLPDQSGESEPSFCGGGHFPLSTAFVCPCFDLKLPSQNQDENCRYIF